MRRMSAILGGLAMAAILGVSLAAEPATVRGEVIDVQCHTKKASNTGEAHEDCAMSCAKRGAKMGILTEDGVYVIAGDYTADNNKKLLPYVAKTVSATGEVMEHDGEKMITVTKIEAAGKTN